MAPCGLPTVDLFGGASQVEITLLASLVLVNVFGFFAIYIHIHPQTKFRRVKPLISIEHLYVYRV